MCFHNERRKRKFRGGIVTSADDVMRIWVQENAKTCRYKSCSELLRNSNANSASTRTNCEVCVLWHSCFLTSNHSLNRCYRRVQKSSRGEELTRDVATGTHREQQWEWREGIWEFGDLFLSDSFLADLHKQRDIENGRLRSGAQTYHTDVDNRKQSTRCRLCGGETTAFGLFTSVRVNTPKNLSCRKKGDC